jgi:hypothetical protein
MGDGTEELMELDDVMVDGRSDLLGRWGLSGFSRAF